MTAVNIPEIIERLKERQAALGPYGDLRTEAERTAWWATTRETARTITALQNPYDTKAEGLLADLEQRRAAVVAMEEEIVREIDAAPDPASFADGRERDRAYDRQRDLRRQLERLREGTLLAAPGVTFDRLGDLDARIAEKRRRIARAQQALDAALKQAEVLLAATTT